MLRGSQLAPCEELIHSQMLMSFSSLVLAVVTVAYSLLTIFPYSSSVLTHQEFQAQVKSYTNLQDY